MDAPRARTGRATGNTILIVEHDPATLDMLRSALEDEGHNIVAAHDAQTALLRMHEAEEAQEGIDLVIQDLALPDMASSELARRLRTYPGGSAVPILASSGFLTASEGASALGSGFSALLVKPLTAARVTEVVSAHVPSRDNDNDDLGAGRRLLLVDDDPVQLKLASFQLRRLGFVVDTAGDGEEALARARANPPAAIVSDVLMPRMDGFQLCLSVRRDSKLGAIPVLLLSSQYLADSDRDLAARVGASQFIPRTPTPTDLIRALRDALADTRVPKPSVPSETLDVEHIHRVVSQLERQTTLATGLAQTCAIQAAQLSVLEGVSGALVRGGSVETILKDILPGCLDPVGISKAVVYLRGETSDVLVARHSIGLSESERVAAADGFDCVALIRSVIEAGAARRFSGDCPGEAAPLLARLHGASVHIAPLGTRARIGALVAVAGSMVPVSSDPSGFVSALAAQVGQALSLAGAFSELERAVAARDEFIAVASHELRTPLTSLALLVRQLRTATGGESKREAGPLAAKLAHGVARLSTLVERLLDVTRISAGRLAVALEPLDLAAVAREAADGLGAQLASRIVVEAPELVTGSWDRFRLEMAIGNVLSNALKFSEKPVHVAVRREGELALVVVTDRGIGIAKSDIERIFLRFERAASRNYGGLGVGLWIAQHSVSALGGRIRVASEQGSGSVFTIELPLHSPAPVAGGEGAAPQTVTHRPDTATRARAGEGTK